MAYRVNKTNGEVLATIADGTVNNLATNLVLIGRNYYLYGEFQNENFVALLENAADGTPPSAPMTGQLWFNTDTSVLNVWDGVEWDGIGLTSTGITRPISPGPGDLWFDTENEQLYAWNGVDEWLLVGPQFPKDAGLSGTVVEGILDTTDTIQYVTVTYSGAERVSITSNVAEFTPAVAIPGFPTIRPGVQLAETVTAGTPLFDGSATNALVAETALTAYTIVDDQLTLIANVTNDRLTLNGEPIDNLHATTKYYVDD